MSEPLATNGDGEYNPPPHPQLIIDYDPQTGAFQKMITGAGMPHAGLVNMLELLKMELLQQQFMLMAQAQAQAQQVQQVRRGIVLPPGT